MCLQGAYRSWSPPLVKVVSCEPRLAPQRLAEFVNNESTRKALSFFQNIKEQTLRKQIFSAILYLYLFSQLSARIFPKRGCGGIPPPNPLLPPPPSVSPARTGGDRFRQQFFRK